MVRVILLLTIEGTMIMQIEEATNTASRPEEELLDMNRMDLATLMKEGEATLFHQIKEAKMCRSE